MRSATHGGPERGSGRPLVSPHAAAILWSEPRPWQCGEVCRPTACPAGSPPSAARRRTCAAARQEAKTSRVGV